ncbi:FtsK/SpoIIIE family DNA translocase [Aggregatilinea lenta]|uniref:FtsK/SpoIIIE family DNA translocase n=1 Tax=Aggregatilinea lenta TaxID=913108 RepID=UPI000E5C04EF|nr:DNA translocase FtsK [Aggregatilinea lenta]
MASKKTASGGRSVSDEKPASRSRASNSAPRASQPKGKSPKASSSPKARSTRTSQRPPIAKRTNALQQIRSAFDRLRGTLTDPAFWQRQRDQLPPWTDEIAAILLIVLGVVILTALLNTTSQAALSRAISRLLRQIFGTGGYVIAAAVMAGGAIILLRKFGIVIRLGWTRIVALEMAFGSLQALLHLAANDPEPRALAGDGGGGGYVGWALSQLTAGLGRGVSFLVFGLLLIASTIAVIGLRRKHVIAAAAWLSAQLERSLTRLDEIIPAEPATPSSATSEHRSPMVSRSPRLGHTRAGDGEARIPYSRPSVVQRVTPAGDGDEEPAPDPAQSEHHTPSRAAQARNMRLRRDTESLSQEDRNKLVEETRRSLGAENGRSLIAPGAPGARASIVPRDYASQGGSNAARGQVRENDEGAPERYFTVEDFREVKKIGKRDEVLPPLDLLNTIELDKPTEEEINTNARIIKNTLLEFDVEVEVVDVKVGPTVTMYAVSPYTETVTDDGAMVTNRVRVGQIANLSSDLALALSAKRLRIQAPVPGHSYVGVEVPNRKPSTVTLRPVLESENFYKNRNRPLAMPLGRDVSGETFIADLQTMPHLLVAGTTGSGKSIMLAAMTTAFILNNPPDQLKLILLDPKMVELSRFNGLPHLLGPVETELDRIIGVLRWSTREMERRYKLLEKEAARNIETYNKLLGRRRKDEHLPYLVIVIDEIGDLMMQRPDETERALTRLAQMARAVGIHLMVATQRPSVDVITGLIKANFPARISFAVASSVDSRVVLDYTGAETLMGRGDMLYLAADAAGPQRIQGCYISDEEVNDVVEHWRTWHAQEVEAGRMDPGGIAPWERGLTRREVLSETDPMLEEAIALVVNEGEASASLIQRRLGLGYPRAARLVDLMHELGIVGPAQPGGKSRSVTVKPGDDPFKQLVDKRLKNR